MSASKIRFPGQNFFGDFSARQWSGIYAALGFLYLAAATGSLYVKHRITNEYESRLAEAQTWGARFHAYAGIGHAASEIRGSSQDAAISGNAAGEWLRVQQLRHLCEQEIEQARKELNSASDAPAAKQLQTDLDVVHTAVEAMAIETDRLFSDLTADATRARSHLSLIDEKYQTVIRAFSHLRAHLEAIEQDHVEAQMRAASLLEKVEYVISVLIAGLVAGIGYFWVRVAKRIRADVAEKEILLCQVRDAENKYGAIFDNVVEGIFQMTPDGRFITANRALARMFGYETPQQLMSELTDVGGRLYADPARRAELLRVVQKEEVVSAFEVEMIRRDGSTIWVSQNARAVRNASGDLAYIEGTVEDITSRWRAERRRRLLYITTKILAEAETLAGGASEDIAVHLRNPRVGHGRRLGCGFRRARPALRGSLASPEYRYR